MDTPKSLMQSSDWEDLQPGMLLCFTDTTGAFEETTGIVVSNHKLGMGTYYVEMLVGEEIVSLEPLDLRDGGMWWRLYRKDAMDYSNFTHAEIRGQI